MSESNTELSVNARKNEQLILRMITHVGQRQVSRKLQLEDKYVSEFKNNKNKFGLKQLSELFVICGLKVVPVDQKAYPTETIAAILRLAKERMAQIEDPNCLLDDSVEGE